MNKEDFILNKTITSITKKALIKNGFDVKEAKNRAEAIEILRDIIEQDAIIGYGGSRTLDEINFHNVFNKKDYPNLLDRNIKDITPEQKLAVQRESLSADYFVCSVNSMTADGQLILIDKWGNRNAAATFGPKKRIFVTGWNKITSSLDEALKRASDKAAVLNNIRFNTGNPCTSKCRCMNCDSEERLCSVTTIISRCQPVSSAVVILIEENLGF